MPHCKHVFVDVGANIGMHARFLFEPEAYPKSAYVRLFRRLLGHKQNETCAIEIEPNPLHAARHRALQARYRSKGRSYVYLQRAVAAGAENLTFFLNPQEGSRTASGEPLPSRCRRTAPEMPSLR